MGVFKATKNANTGGVFKATKNRSYDSAFVSRLEDENRESSSRLNDYITRRQADEWMSEDDIQGYRDALERYRSSSKALSDLRRSFGSYSDEEEKQRTSYIDSIAADLDSSSSMFKSYKNADEYGAAVSAYKEREAMKTANLDDISSEITALERKLESERQKIGNNSALSLYPDKAKDFFAGTNITGIQSDLDAKRDYYNRVKEVQDYENHTAAEMYKLADEATENTESLYWRNLANQRNVQEKANTLAGIRMDGERVTVLEALNDLSSIEDVNSRRQREKAIKNKMASLGLDFDDYYSRITGEGNFSLGDAWNWAKSAFFSGAASWNKGISSTADLILGKPLQALGWEKNPISEAADYFSDSYNNFAFDRSLYASKMGGGKALDYAGQFVEGVISAVPDAILAGMTAGASAGAGLTSSGLATKAAYQSGDKLTKAGLTIEGMMKNPNYWSSFARTYGLDYEEAKASGASDTAAAFGATITSLINAGIEIGFDGGSGFQGLAQDLADGGRNKFWAWAESSLEEGGEEVLQGFVNNLVSKVMYDDSTELANIEQMIAEGGMGVAVGAALGGGEVILRNAANSAVRNQEIKKAMRNFTEFSGKSIVEGDTVRRLVESAGTLGNTRAEQKLKALAESIAGVDQTADGFSKKSKSRLEKSAGKLYLGLVEEKGKSFENARREAISDGIRKELEVMDVKDIDRTVSALTKYAVGGNLTKSEKALMDMVGGKSIVERVMKSGVDENTERAYADYNSSAALPFVSREDTELGGKKHVDVRDRVSSTGYTVNADTGENITVNKDNAIARIENGEAYINTDKGTVKLSNIEFSNENEARLYESFLDYDPATASALIKNYDGRISVERYVDGMRQGINVYGKYNFQGVGIDISKDSYFADLSPTDQRFALNIGRSIARAEVQAAQMAVASKTAVKTKGKVQFADGVTAETKAQKNGVALAKHLASALGINITFFDSTNDVQHRNDNGWYDPSTDSIHIDINAGDNHEGTIAYTLGHELTHFIKKWSPEKFKVFGDFLVEQYGKHGISTQEMLEAQMAKLNTTDEAIAYEEMVADACQTMLLDSNAVEKLIQLRQQDKGLFEKIREFIRNILDKLRSEYKNIDPNSDESKALRSMTDVVEQMSALFEDAAVDAAQAYQSADTATIRGSQDGFVVKNDATDTGSLTGTMKSTKTERVAMPKMIMALSSGSEGKLVTDKDVPGITATMIDGVVKGNVVNGYTVAQIREETMKANGFTSSQIKRMQAFMQSMAKFMDDAGVKYRFIGLKDVEDAKLHYTYNKDGSIKSIVLSAMVKNGDYPVNFDFSSICKKRVAMSRLINKLCGSGAIDSGTVNLTPENIFEINKAIKDAGYESACLGCFVESKRYNVQEWAKSFIKKYNSAVLKVNPNATYFSFTDGETDFDNVTASQVIAIDNAANKFLDSTGRERRNKAKSFFKENVDNGRPALAKRPKKGESYNPEEHLKPLPKSARDRLIKSESIDDITKERLLSKWNDPASISLEEAEFLVDNGIIGGRAISNKQLVTKLVESGEQFQHLLRPSDLLTEKGLSQLEQLPNFHGVLYGHYGSGTPKLVQGFTPYNSEIALLADNKGNQTLAEYLYSIAGVRMQSFSDFQIQNIFDYLQMVADLSARKLPAHAYTKEISFAKLLGMTGIKTNLSVMFDIDPSVDDAHAGLTKYNPAIHQGEYAKIVLEDEQGKWVYNIGDYATQKAYENYDRMMGNEPVKRFLQSIGFADAVKLQTTEGYTKNCGIIGVGYSDLHILAMLDDPRIRYIIPYHASSLPQAIKIATYISKAIDYTSTQNTMKIVSITGNNGKSVDWSIKEAYKRLKSGKAVIEELNKHIKEDGWKVETKKSQNGHGSFDLYGDLSVTSDPRATAENFMSWCAKNGTLPLFYQFAGHNNYYKLLYDFNVYDNVTGEYAPQQAVTNTYPTEDGSGANVVDGNFNEEFFQSMIDGYMMFQNSFNEELDSTLDEIADKITSNTLPGADFAVSVKKSSRNSYTSQMDEEYLELAKNPEKNEKRLREILYGKAKEEGFTPEHLYHGTSTFGFTKTDVSKSDDGISFFATDNIDVAQGYFPFYEDDYDSYHDSVREIGRKDKKTRKALSVYDDVSSIISSIKEMYPDEYEDARLATDDEVMSDLNDYWIPEAVEAAKSLLGYSIPKNVRELVDAVVKTYEDGSVDAWRLLSKDYKKYDEIYDIYYNGSYFFQATHLWNKVKTGLQMISKGLKYESVKNGNEIVSVATIVDRYNTSIGGENNGIYDLFARHDKQLVIRCNGSNWNNIRLGDISKEFNDWWVNEEGKDEAFISADTRTISKFAKQNGYRSVCFVDIYDSGAYGSRGDLSTVYAFFYPEEDIKSADLVTYDDNGNVIPLSERFRTDRKGRDAWKNEDIRYSKKNNIPYSTRNKSNREILAEALETTIDTSTADGEAEAAKLAEYKKHIEELDKLQAHLKEVNAEIRDLTFGNTPRDPERLRALKEDKAKTENRIHIYDKKLLRLESTKPLMDVLERERKRVKQETVRAFRETYKEKKSKTETRRKIKRIAEDFRRRLTRSTEYSYVPKQLADGIISVCNEIDPTWYDQSSKAAERFRSGKAALLELKSQYDRLKTDSDYDFSSEFNEEFSSNIDALAEAVGNTPLREMSADQLEDVYGILSDIKVMLTDATRQIGMSERITNYEAGQEVIKLMHHIKAKSLTTGALSSFFRNWTENPMRAVREMSAFDPDSRLVKLFDSLNEGRRKMETFRMEAYKEFDALRSSKEGEQAFNDAVEKPYDFGLLDVEGKPLKISKMQAMQLVLTWNREQANPKRKHLQTGAIIPDVDLLRKGRYQAAFDNGQQIGMVTQETIASIMDRLSEWDKQYMELARKLFNETARDAINETTLLTKHRIVAGEKEYIPYTVNEDYIAKDSDNVRFDATIEGMGMLKSVSDNAPQMLVMGGLNRVISSHIDSVGKYYGLAVPIRNWNKVFNMKQTAGDGGRSVKAALRGTWSESGVKLLDQAVADLQTPRRHDSVKALTYIKSVFVQSTLSSNISVWMKQAASYPTAGAILSNKSLVKGLWDYMTKIKDGVHAQDVWNEIDSHTSQHWLRRQGLSMQELAEMNQSGGWQNKLNKKLGKMSPMNWIQSMDVGTTAALWFACKSEVESEGKFQKGSEEYWNEVTGLYDRVIEETQPMYDSLHRAEITKKQALGNVILFQTQPLQNSGILRESAMELKMAKKQYGSTSAQAKSAGRKFRMAVMSQAASHFVFTAMTLMSMALLHKMNPWKDDDDNLTPESIALEFAKRFGENYLGAIIPIFGTMGVSMADKLFGGSRYDVFSDSVIDKVNGTIDTFSNLKNPSFSAFSNAFCEVASYFGIPAQNAYNIIRGFILNVNDILGADHNAVIRAVEGGNQYNGKSLYEAIVSGDDEWVNYIREKNNYDDDSSYEAAAKNALKNNDPRIKEAIKARVKGNSSLYQQIRQSIIDEGKFDKQTVNDALKSEYNYYVGKIDDAAKLLKEGDIKSSNNIIRELKKKYKGTFTQDDIMRDVKIKAGIQKK